MFILSPKRDSQILANSINRHSYSWDCTGNFAVEYKTNLNTQYKGYNLLSLKAKNIDPLLTTGDCHVSHQHKHAGAFSVYNFASCCWFQDYAIPTVTWRTAIKLKHYCTSSLVGHFFVLRAIRLSISSIAVTSSGFLILYHVLELKSFSCYTWLITHCANTELFLRPQCEPHTLPGPVTHSGRWRANSQ